MALIKKFKIEKFKGEETIVEIKNASVFYNKRQILNNLNLKKPAEIETNVARNIKLGD